MEKSSDLDNPHQSPSVALDEVEEYRTLCSGVTACANEATRVLARLNDELDTAREDDGLSFLTVKNICMLEYLADLAYIALLKSNGKSICGEAAVERIVENRIVLEKMRPIEKKMKYQIDKYLKVAENGGQVSNDDPLCFKPDLNALYECSDDGGSDCEVATSGADKKYVVPKHVPTLCEDDIDPEEVQRDEAIKVKKKLLSKSILEDLKRQHSENPEEVFHQSDTLKAKRLQVMRERTMFEEENYMRLPAMSKKEKHRNRKSMTTMGSLGAEMTFFGSNNFFNDDMEGKGGTSRRGKKRKIGSKKGRRLKRFK